MLQVGFGMLTVVSTMTETTPSTPVTELVEAPPVGIILQSSNWVVTLDVMVVVVEDDVEAWHENGTVSMKSSTMVVIAPFTSVFAVIEVLV
jgi:hypothetical protein